MYSILRLSSRRRLGGTWRLSSRRRLGETWRLPPRRRLGGTWRRHRTRLRAAGWPIAEAITAVLVTGLLPVGGQDAGAAQLGPTAGASGRYRLPVPDPQVVITPFRAQTGPYSAGHLGVDLKVSPGDPVRVAARGRVQFAGAVAGRSLIVVLHPDGISTEYEPLVSVMVKVGQEVVAGQQIAAATSGHRGCTVTCLHWGARRNGNYFDPLTLLHRLGVIRLLPCQARGWAC